jgi:DNA-binding CsgD family transcriptional regulator
MEVSAVTVVEETLVGRQAELATVEEILARAEARPQGIVLEGEAGIGKTRLWKAGVQSAHERNFRVLSTRPGGSEVKLAFAGLADLLDGVAAEALPQLPPPQRRALEVALLLEEPGSGPPDDRAVAAAFLGALRFLAERGPVLIAVDDLQWLDASSEHVLEFACRRLEEEGIGVLATVRLGPGERRTEELVRALGGERLERLEVGPLTVAALYELIGAHLGLSLQRPVLLQVHEASGGNPFFALELVRALLRADVEPAPGEPLPVPPNLRELVEGRLSQLPRPAGATLRFVAALSRPTVGVVERAVGSAERATRDLGRAATAGLIELQGEQIRFTHPLLASIHLGAATPRTRRATHRRLADVVLDPEEQAKHLALATERPEASVAAALEAAAEHARSRGAVAMAAELAEQAFLLTPSELRERAYARRLAAAELQYAAGATARAVELLDDALDDTAVGPTRAELLWSLGKIRFEGQDTRVGYDLFRRALRETGDDDLLRARILESLTFPAAKREGFLAARGYARQAAEIAEQLGDTSTLARALAMIGHYGLLCGDGLDTELFERAVGLEEQLERYDLSHGATVSYAWALSMAGELERARPLLERLCEQGRTTGDAAVNLPLFLLATLEYESGNWDRAARRAKESYDVAVQSGREAAEPRGLFVLAHVEAAKGDVEGARTKAEQALVMTDGRGWSSGGPRAALGFLELSLEHYEAAYEALRPAVDVYRRLGAPLIEQTFDAAEALAQLGRVEEARALLGSAEKAQGMLRFPWAEAAVARARGLLAAAEGDLDCAQEDLEAAVETGELVGIPLSLGRSLLALGTVQRQARKKHAARESLGRALEIFERLGAPLWAERARRELARIGGRSSRREGLSGTEAEIVELVVAGRSNKEVAQALHLSTKTVEWNLTKVYRRLGVHSRTELAARRPRA